MTETRPLTRYMDEKFEELFSLMARIEKKMEAGQEEMKQEMRSAQNRMEQVQDEVMKRRDEMRKKIDKDEMRTLVESQVEGISNHIDECIEKIEEEVQCVKGKIEKVENEVQRKIEKVEENVQRKTEEAKGELQGKICNLERRLSELEERPKNFQTSPELMYSRPPVKPSTIDRQKSWSVCKPEFDVVSSTNGCTEFVKIWRKPSHQFYRTELKSRRQRPGESLQVLTADVERLMSPAYAECPLDVRKSLASQCFVDGIRDEGTQNFTRLMDAKDMKSAVVHSLKYEAAKNPDTYDQ
ncbi:hypothetical protein AVEN_164497-1 [Araneus ventricosus]|uniref:Uncharacterized protein n=1 Tax=Araneus ventricosus TaxID=182803 RepID=A0A4Y2QIQ2_ARAVE|nr:hypothetical protein AVEN_164497-1 [Araneus ventricosus]